MIWAYWWRYLALQTELTEERSAVFHLAMDLHFIVTGFSCSLSVCFCHVLFEFLCLFSHVFLFHCKMLAAVVCQGCNYTSSLQNRFCRLMQKSNLSHWYYCRSRWRWHDVSLMGCEGACGWIKKSFIWFLFCKIFEVNCNRLESLINRGTQHSSPRGSFESSCCSGLTALAVMPALALKHSSGPLGCCWLSP